MSKEWIVQSCFDCTGKNTHIAIGDQLTLTESEESHLVIKRKGDTCLDVWLNSPTNSAFSFARRGRRGTHEKSDHYRGHLTVHSNGPKCDEILTLILGHKCPPGPADGDDDDTEVVVATRPATK